MLMKIKNSLNNFFHGGGFVMETLKAMIYYADIFVKKLNLL